MIFLIIPEISNNSGVSSSEDVELTIDEGWNLLALPKDFPMRTPTSVLCPFNGQLDVVLGFDGQGLTYDPDLPEFSTLTEFDPLHGYWFRAEISGFSAQQRKEEESCNSKPKKRTQRWRRS